MESDWMANLPQELQLIQLNKLAIPGTHNSGAYHLTGEVAPDAPGIVNKLLKVPGLKCSVTSVLKKWCQCQSLSIEQQLNSGIRYLDFRICSKAGSDDLYFVHGLYGSKVKNALDDIKAFLDLHQEEVVITDFNHFYRMNGDHHKTLLAQIKTVFGSKLCDVMNVEDLNLKNLKENKKQVICIYQDPEAEGETYVWQNQCIRAPWPNTKSPETCIRRLTEYMQVASNELCQFVVCQGILTPDIPYTLIHLTRGVQKMNQQLRPCFLSWLDKSPLKWNHQPNIIINDFVEEDGFIQHVLELNKNRTGLERGQTQGEENCQC